MQLKQLKTFLHIHNKNIMQIFFNLFFFVRRYSVICFYCIVNWAWTDGRAGGRKWNEFELD